MKLRQVDKPERQLQILISKQVRANLVPVYNIWN